MKWILVAMIFLVGLRVAWAGEMRVWTDLEGREIEAELLRKDGESVMLKLKDGREISYPLAKLSVTDGKYTMEAAELMSRAATFNFDAPWPERVTFEGDPEIQTISEDAEKERFVYESAHYTYISNVRLANSVVKGFAVMFEATYLYCRALPLSLNGGIPEKGKLEIYLFETHHQYIQAGGPPNSSGVFLFRNRNILVPLTSIGVKPLGSGYMLDRERDSSTLPHELTHQLSPDPYFREGLAWFSEGIAEYVANTPYRSGSFNVRGNQKAIIEYVTGYGEKNKGGRALGTKISLPALKTFMLQDYEQFTAQPNLNYGRGLLLTYYFLHLDGAGDAKRIKAYLNALHEGETAEKALPLLLDGRTFPQLQDEIIKKWGSKGIDLAFGTE